MNRLTVALGLAAVVCGAVGTAGTSWYVLGSGYGAHRFEHLAKHPTELSTVSPSVLVVLFALIASLVGGVIAVAARLRHRNDGD